MKNENRTMDSMALWFDTRATRLLCARVYMSTLLCASVAPALAEDNLPLIWNCWIGDEDPVGIYCIHDRSQFYQAVPKDLDDELESTLLDRINEKILDGRTAGLAKFVREYGGDLREGALWIIPIWSPPEESSWEANMPVRLVKAGLCPNGTPCTVILNKPIH